MSKEFALDQKESAKPRGTLDRGPTEERPSELGPRGAAEVLRLQRLAGNRAVQRLLAQRQGGGDGSSDLLPTAALGTGRTGFELDDETAGRINRARGGGQPLESGLQAQMGEAMGYDFSGVRVHTGTESDELNQQLSARAFTTGQDVFVRSGEYGPASSGGRELIAHELSHVVQQGTGRVPAGGSGMTVRPSGDAFEQEADAVARRAASADGGAATYVAEAFQSQTEKGESAALQLQGAIDSPLVQRHCWTMGSEEVESFTERPEELLHPFGGPGGEVGESVGEGQYFRLQPGDNDSPSKYYGTWTPKYDQVAEDGKVDKSERKVLAVKRDWVPEWHFLVKYRGGRAGYFGHSREQKDEDKTYYQGGAPQVVFPEAAKPHKVAAYPVEEA